MADNINDLESLQDYYDASLDNVWMHKMYQNITDNKWKRPEALYKGGFFLNSAKKYYHFPHIDPEDPNKIRFVDSIVLGRKGKMSSMRIGRYLTKHFKDSIGSEGDVLQVQQQIVYETAPVDVKFAATPDEIEHVYLNGPRSCMSKASDAFQVPENPVRMYAAGDLQVAYIVGADGKKPAGRAVVWPDKKEYVRIYGDKSRVQRGLDDLGYTQVDGFDGARLIKKPYNGTYIMPYVDGNARYVQPDEPMEHFVLKNVNMLNHDYNVHEICSEWGWLWEPTDSCFICDEHNETTGTGTTRRIIVRRDGNRAQRRICVSHLSDISDCVEGDHNLYVCLDCGNLSEPHSVSNGYVARRVAENCPVCARCARRYE